MAISATNTSLDRHEDVISSLVSNYHCRQVVARQVTKSSRLKLAEQQFFNDRRTYLAVVVNYSYQNLTYLAHVVNHKPSCIHSWSMDPTNAGKQKGRSKGSLTSYA